MSASTIEFDNLLDEAKYAAHAGDNAKAAQCLNRALGSLTHPEIYAVGTRMPGVNHG